MGPLPPQTESVEQLIVDALYDLTDAGYPAPEQLGPYFTAGVALGRADEPRPVRSNRATVCDSPPLRSPCRSHKGPRRRPSPHSEALGLARLLVGRRRFPP